MKWKVIDTIPVSLIPKLLLDMLQIPNQPELQYAEELPFRISGSEALAKVGLLQEARFL